MLNLHPFLTVCAYFLLPPLLLLLDYSTYVLLDGPYVQSLLCVLLLQLNLQAEPWLYYTLFFYGLYAHLTLGTIGAVIVPLMMSALISHLANTWLTRTPIIDVCLVTLYIITLNLSIALFQGRIAFLKNYTIWQLCVNIVLILGLSLIIYVAGKQDNRL